MNETTKNNSINQIQRIFLLLSALFLTILLFIIRGGVNSKVPLEQLARQSLDPEIALSNGRPTVLEFYADWCEACREMAPAMLSIENEFQDELDIVLLNVENNRWKDLLSEFSVNGIPQLNFFDRQGALSGTIRGLKQYEDIKSISNSLLNNEPLPFLIVDDEISNNQQYSPI